MAHGINKPYDIILSTDSTEWHGLATKVDAIGAEEIKPLLFPIVEEEIYSKSADGIYTRIPKHKSLMADLSHRTDLPADDRRIFIHAPKEGYRKIENKEVWETMEKALKDVDCQISSVGTLDNLAKFFISVRTLTGDRFKANGDEFLANINFITSHDGQIAFRAYDSTVRIVCMNTLRWSLETVGDLDFSVYHTSNANTAMSQLGEIINHILTGRKKFVEVMEYLDSISVTNENARLIAYGYFVMKTEQEELSTRSTNAAESIHELFNHGKGNKGRSLYDLANGATEYWTHGDGTGKRSDRIKKAYAANFGSAAEHKTNFIHLLANPRKVTDLMEKGEKALAAA